VTEAYAGQQQFVGVDLARRRSVITRMDAAGTVLECVQIDNSPAALVAGVGKAGPGAPVAVEATYGWYWAVDALQGAGFEVHLAHPKGNASMHNRRVKTDARDATELARLLRMGDLAESWIAPPVVRGRRELVRHRHKLVRTRASLKASVHAVLGKCGVLLPWNDLFGPVGLAALAAVELPQPYASRIASQCRLITAISTEIDLVDTAIAAQFKDDPGYRNLLTINGIGPVFASVFVAEIGDITRFPTPQALASWAGLTPRHYASDDKTRRGHITKQGSRLLRWAATEASQRIREPYLADKRRLITDRRGRTAANISKVAAGRRLLHVVYYTLRDGHARCLDQPARQPA
jgi:transposase